MCFQFLNGVFFFDKIDEFLEVKGRVYKSKVNIFGSKSGIRIRELDFKKFVYFISLFLTSLGKDIKIA